MIMFENCTGPPEHIRPVAHELLTCPPSPPRLPARKPRFPLAAPSLATAPEAMDPTARRHIGKLTTACGMATAESLGWAHTDFGVPR